MLLTSAFPRMAFSPVPHRHAAAATFRRTGRGHRTAGADAFGLLSVAVGVVCPQPGSLRSADELVALATAAKREAKRQAGNTIFVRS